METVRNYIIVYAEKDKPIYTFLCKANKFTFKIDNCMLLESTHLKISIAPVINRNKQKSLGMKIYCWSMYIIIILY